MRMLEDEQGRATPTFGVGGMSFAGCDACLPIAGRNKRDAGAVKIANSLAVKCAQTWFRRRGGR